MEVHNGRHGNNIMTMVVIIFMVIMILMMIKVPVITTMIITFMKLL